MARRPKGRIRQRSRGGRRLGQFFESSGCFKSAALQRLAQNADEFAQAAAAEAANHHPKVVLITVRELGPTVKIGASLALVEGGTEVVFDVSEFSPQSPWPRQFTVQWRDGGPGVIKGVAGLKHDMRAALAAGLKPPAQ